MHEHKPAVSLLVCRGCCCATEDPAAERRQIALADAAADMPDIRVSFTNCLGPCGEADIVAVRQRSGSTTWLGGIDDDVVVTVVEWIRLGAPEALPAAFAPFVLDRTAHAFTPDHEMTPSDRPLAG